MLGSWKMIIATALTLLKLKTKLKPTMEIEFIKEGTSGFQRLTRLQVIPQKSDYVHLMFMENGYAVERQFHVKEIHHRIEQNKIIIYIK